MDPPRIPMVVNTSGVPVLVMVPRSESASLRPPVTLPQRQVHHSELPQSLLLPVAAPQPTAVFGSAHRQAMQTTSRGLTSFNLQVPVPAPLNLTVQPPQTELQSGVHFPPPPPLPPPLPSRFGSCIVQANERVPFRVLRSTRSPTRLFDVDHNSRAYRVGLRDFALLLYVNAEPVQQIPLQQLLQSIYAAGGQAVQISWENDAHQRMAETRTTPEQLQRARQRTQDVISEYLRQQRQQRVLGHSQRGLLQQQVAGADEIAHFLADEHARLTRFTSADIFLQYGPSCEYCDARRYRLEPLNTSKFCCMNGACLEHTFLPQLEPLPDVMRSHLVSHCEVLSHHSLRINQSLNIAAVGLDPSRAEGGRGLTANIPNARIQCLSFHGRIYRSIRPGHDISTPANWLMYNAENEHNVLRDTPEEQIVHEIVAALKHCNPLFRELRALGENPDQELGLRIRGYSHHNELAIVRASDFNSRGRTCLYIWKNQPNARSTTIPLWHGSYEALAFPLLFTHGEAGWDFRLEQFGGPSILAYTRARLLIPENIMVQSLMGSWIRVNRFQLMARMLQMYALENFARYIDMKLEYFRKHQNLFHRRNRQPPPDELQEENMNERPYNYEEVRARQQANVVSVDDLIGQVHDDEEADQPDATTIPAPAGRSSESSNSESSSIDNSNSDAEDDTPAHRYQRIERTLLPASFIWSYRHKKMRASNALHLVARLGRPTLFITATTNPRWAEITRELLPGQLACDRPDITCRVFYRKLQVLMDCLLSGEFFNKRVVYHVHVIEFQKRGLPHAHIVLKLVDMPQARADVQTWVDANIQTTCEVADDDPKYVGMVADYMTHSCDLRCLSGVGLCSKGFPKPKRQTLTFNQETGFPEYRRITDNDAMIVPHTRGLLLMWDGHINVEYCASSLMPVYLYKYLFKGPDQAEYRVRPVNDRQDEIASYVRGRYISAMEAVWFILGFSTFPTSSPAVQQLSMFEATSDERHRGSSTLTKYFRRPAGEDFDNILYHQFFEVYEVRTRPVSRGHHDIMFIDGMTYYCVKPQRRKLRFCRITTIFPNAGELFYERLLLLHKAARSIQDLQTIDGVTYETCQQAAKALGLIDDGNETYNTLADAMGGTSPNGLRRMFAAMMMHGFPTAVIFYDNSDDNQVLRFMLRDLDGDGFEAQKEALLNELDRLLAYESKKLTLFGLPAARAPTDELQLYRDLHGEQSLQSATQELQQLLQGRPLSRGQQQVFDAVKNAFTRCVPNGRGTIIFVQGGGGTGKTHLTRVCDAWIRSQQDATTNEPAVSLICATTALAAQNFKHGTTAHSLFKIPADDVGDESTEEAFIESRLKFFPGAQELLAAAKFIAWDEFPSAHKQVFEAAFNAVNAFRGKVLLCTGDLRQLTPVVKSSGVQKQLEASIVNSNTWEKFRVFTLTQNYRQHADLPYAQWAASVGEGRDGGVYDALTGYRATVDMSAFVTTTFSQQTEMQAIQWTYPDLFNRNHRTETDRAIAMARCAILANTNDRVGAWNQAVQQLVPSNQSKIYYSADHLCDLEGTDAARRGTNTQEVITEEFLHYCDKADVPVHKLFLKVGDLAILMRNIDKAAGLTNNQRIVIQGLRRHTVVVSIANDPRKELHYISRLSFRFTVPGTSFDMTRKQFPIKLAYAFTVHKAQGQELGQVLIDTSTPTFAHGQLYVALSRVTHRRTLAVYMPEEQRLTGQVTADNVVLTQLIEHLTNS